MKSPFIVMSTMFLALTSLAGCTAPLTLPPGATLDGTFTVELGEITGIDDKPVAGSAAKQTWAIRTACPDSGCVATVTALPGGDPAKPPSYTTVLDFVDGKWIGARETEGECKAMKKAPFWVTYSLEPRPDGVIAGKRWEIFANDACVGTRTVTMKRTGDVNPAVTVADPEKLPSRATSPAAGFRGLYRDKLVDQAIGETDSDDFYDVDTFCLRTGDRCISSFVSENRKSNQAYVFADSKWVTNPTPFVFKCDDGRDNQRTRTGVLTLPESVRDPIQTLTGTVHSRPRAPVQRPWTWT
jgi:hypothetical protein